MVRIMVCGVDWASLKYIGGRYYRHMTSF